MNNIVKNLLLALTLVCVIALIVFCIQLIVFNTGGDPVDAGPVISGDAQDEDSDENGDEASTDGDTGGDDETAAPQETPQLPPQGTRHQIMVTPDSTRLIVYAREDLFDFETGEIDYWFIYRGIGEATLEISFTSISPLGMAVTAESFLNRYTDDTTSVVSGEEYIRGSSVRGYHVSAMAAGGTYEAWIHDLVDSDLALVFVIFYENEAQRDALYEVLSTLEMELITAGIPVINDQDDTTEAPVVIDRDDIDDDYEAGENGEY